VHCGAQTEANLPLVFSFYWQIFEAYSKTGSVVNKLGNTDKLCSLSPNHGQSSVC
jgi:hypothetical protein